MTAIDVALLYRVVDMLRSERLLIAVDGTISLDGRYACVNFEERRAEYGEYEFRTTGFGRVVERMSSSVVAIEVEDADSKPSIGTGFFIGNQHTIITARHVVENMRLVRVLGPPERPSRSVRCPSQQTVAWILRACWLQSMGSQEHR